MLLSRLCLTCNKRFSFPEGKPTTLCNTCMFNSNVMTTCIYNKHKFKVKIRQLKQIYHATYWAFYEKNLLSPGMVVGYISPFTHKFFIGIIKNIWGGLRNIIEVVPIRRPGHATAFILNSHEVKCTDILCLFKLCRETTQSPLATE